MLFSEQLSSFSEQLFGILRAQSGHAYSDWLLNQTSQSNAQFTNLFVNSL
jgi:hypothetical protein